MKVYIENKDKEFDVKFNGKALDLLRKLKINPVTVVLTKNQKLITEQDMLDDGDRLEILDVVSGG